MSSPVQGAVSYSCREGLHPLGNYKVFLTVAERVYRKLWSQVFMCVDKALKTPNGFAWILFQEEASVAKSLKLYHEGHAAIYGSPFIISVVDADIQDAGDAGQSFSPQHLQKIKNRRGTDLFQRKQVRYVEKTSTCRNNESESHKNVYFYHYT